MGKRLWNIVQHKEDYSAKTQTETGDNDPVNCTGTDMRQLSPVFIAL